MLSGWKSRRHSISALRLGYGGLFSGARSAQAQFQSGPYETSHSHSYEKHRTTLEEFIGTLQNAGLAGPLQLSGSPEKIGEGGQFYVFKEKLIFLESDAFSQHLVAVKQPRLRPERDPDLAERHNQMVLNHLRVEIRALTNDRLRDNPHIGRILGWSTRDNNWESPLVLILELAFGDLGSYLETDTGMDQMLKIMLCGDIAKGLDAIHEVGFVHGDLKTGNALLFHSKFRIVAKLADFGFSTEKGVQAAGATPGWEAPERISFPEADRFSFGLLLWSVFLFNGATLPKFPGQASMDLAARDLETKRNTLFYEIHRTLQELLNGCLSLDTSARPIALTGYFTHLETTSPNSDHTDRVIENKLRDIYQSMNRQYNWEIPALARHILLSLYRRFEQSKNAQDAILPKELLAIALFFTFKTPPDIKDPGEAICKLLQAAAKRRDPAACALSVRVASYYKKELATSRADTIEWLRLAVVSGSIHSRSDLKQLDPTALTESLQSFCESGGFNPIYSDIQLALDASTFTDFNQLHWLAAFGTVEDLKTYLTSNELVDIDAVTEKTETGLFLACSRGSWGHAKAILDHGANPTIKCTEFGVTCLHWAFAFDEASCAIAVQNLIRAGADVDALVTTEIPFPHFPFILPAGSPLHWAVATANHDAIHALIEANADPLIRNGSDPYTHDERVRSLYTIGGPESEPCTLVESNCMGLSPLDLSALHRDPYIFKVLTSRDQEVDVNSTDEEGFTVLHRMASDCVFRTSLGSRYSSILFRDQNEVMVSKTMVEAIVQLGGDLERLTSFSRATAEKESKSWMLAPSYSPLMLASMEGDYRLVEALIDCGASANTENLSKCTALNYISYQVRDQTNMVKCAQILLSAGADINHVPSKTGLPPVLLMAASPLGTDLFEFLLQKGAHIDTIDHIENSFTHGQNAFSRLAMCTEKRDEEAFLRILRDHVIDAVGGDTERQKRVIQGTDTNGRTLLHECSAQGMYQSVELLLKNGARVNSLERKHQFTWRNDRRLRKVWYESPLDCTKRRIETIEYMMQGHAAYSIEQYELLQSKWDAVLRVLAKFGAGPSTAGATLEPWD